jgi:lipopolysaccharide transport system ATP-binding protein
MSTDTVIQIENLSKQYRLGEVSTGALSHDLNRWWCRVRGKSDPYLKVTQTNVRDQKSEITQASDYVWALKDINLEIKRGDVLGVIGRNGAGKSTLLKILSRVTAPTTGEVRIDGRIASLLEVGTGFHPELTGRENIFLNGAILGMTKNEIRSKLDDIVEFSGCSRYLDTPVKRYSSGMMVRLGFAVAAHLEQEILIVDEVLAVGDAEFQKKCIGKMQDVASKGRTVLFVSHNMSAIQKICSHSIVLRDGRLVCGPLPSAEAVHRYLGEGKVRTSGPVTFQRDVFTLDDFRVTTLSGHPVDGAIPHDQAHAVEIRFTLDRYDAAFNVGYALYNQDAELVYLTLTTDAEPEKWPRISQGKNCVRSIIPPYLLNEGEYQLVLIASFHCAQWLAHPDKDGVAIPLAVRMGPGASPYWHGKRAGQLAPLLYWDGVTEQGE